jgi:hypothetical protein
MKGSQASLLDMAEMFAMKYQKDGHLKEKKSITESAAENEDEKTP